MLAEISANLRTGKQYNPLGMAVGNRFLEFFGP